MMLSASATFADEFSPALPMPSRGLDEGMTMNRIALGSCFNQAGSGDIFTKVLEAEPDIFLFLGDNVYASDESDDPELTSLKQAYGQLAGLDSFSALRQAMPVLTIWDDHDYGLNDAGGDWPRKYTAEALYEHVWNIGPDDPRSQREGVYFAHNIGPEGRRVQLIFLDTRFFRTTLTSNETDSVGPYQPSEDPGQSMLGNDQWQWLQERLDEPAELRLIISSIMVLSESHGWESWRMMPLERQRLYNLLNSTEANGVIIVSGDTHAGAIYRSETTLDYPLVELNTSSMNVPLSSFVKNPKQVAGVHRLGDTFFEANYGLIDIDWETGEISVQMRDKHSQSVRKHSINLSALQ